MNVLFAKFALPIIGALVLGFGGYAAGVYQVSNRPIEVKTECQCEGDKILKQIDEKLANMEKANSINIDKLKGFKGTFAVNQNYTVKGDSAMRKLIVNDLKAAMSELRLSRCK